MAAALLGVGVISTIRYRFVVPLMLSGLLAGMDDLRETDSRLRHKWVPVLVLSAAAGWWLWRASYAHYQTVLHVAVLLLSAVSTAVWFLIFGGFSWRVRRTIVGGLALALVVFFVAFRPVYNGDMGVYRWRPRFASSADQKLEQLNSSSEVVEWQNTSADYPRFLGNGYWAEVKGVELEGDWRLHPPKELWRREIGAGWSAFAIAGNYAVTQEQRGENELVTCYRVQTGEPVWTHGDATRFDPPDAIGGLGDVGPRATPTIHGDRIFTQGGTGIVNCLDARTGHVVWSHDTAAEFGATVTLWGKSGSPLIVDDMVLISVGAPTGGWEAKPADSTNGRSTESTPYNSSLVAFDMKSGAVCWSAGSRQASYASPVVATLGGQRQIIVVNESWVTAHRTSDGKVLWEQPWSSETDTNASCSEPVPLDDDRLLLSKGYGSGCSLLAIKKGSDGRLSANPLWNPPIKSVMKTKMCNVVVRDGFIYGLDDVLLECIELETGAVQWKKRRRPEFGHGQIMLIGNVILALSESGELALVEANPREYTELSHLQALDSANVTWNNPAFAPPYLLIRNAREAACYRLPVKQ
jgi:outer membrane protein assembly factor BamB